MIIARAFTFEAAHRLPNVPATHRCYGLHGHSYRVVLRLEGRVDPHTGFVADFFDIDDAFKPVLDELDHGCLNDLAGLENPTAENIAIWIWRRVKPEMPPLSGIVVYETPDCWAEYDGADGGG